MLLINKNDQDIEQYQKKGFVVLQINDDNNDNEEILKILFEEMLEYYNSSKPQYHFYSKGHISKDINKIKLENLVLKLEIKNYINQFLIF